MSHISRVHKHKRALGIHRIYASLCTPLHIGPSDVFLRMMCANAGRRWKKAIYVKAKCGLLMGCCVIGTHRNPHCPLGRISQVQEIRLQCNPEVPLANACEHRCRLLVAN